MADIMKDVEALFARARQAEGAPPLDAAETMRRVRSCIAPAPVIHAAGAPRLPLRFLLGVASAAAVLAIAVGLFASASYDRLSDPLQNIGMLPDLFKLLRM